MKRAYVVLIALMVGSQFAVTAWILRGKNVSADIMHEGRTVGDVIHEHDPSVRVYWTSDEHGNPNIVIRDLLDQAR